MLWHPDFKVADARARVTASARRCGARAALTLKERGDSILRPMAAEFSFAIDLPIRNRWSNIDLLRTSIANCFSAVFQDLDGCQILAMVASELLENALKYGDWETRETTFRLRVWGSADEAHVMVENARKPDDRQAENLTATLDALKAFPTPADAYRAKLLELAQSSPEPDVSGLGLARVAYEANCVLRADVTDSTVCVTADMRVADILSPTDLENKNP
jgi:hypothetical protein